MSTETRTFTVTGMTCAHCVLSVQEEVAELAGVVAARAELATGRLEVTGTFTDAQVAEAVADAGYAVTP